MISIWTLIELAKIMTVDSPGAEHLGGGGVLC